MNVLLHLKNWLNKPYFIIQSKRAKLIIILVISFVVFFNINFLRPYGINNLQNNIFYFALGYSFIIFSVLFTYFFIATSLFSKFFDEEKWTIKKEIIGIVSVLTAIAILGWAYTNKVQIGGKNPENFTLLAFFKYTFSGIFPVIIYLFLAELLLDKFRKDASKQVIKGKKKQIKEPIIKTEKIKISSTNNKDFIEVNLKELVYVTSEGNYVSFFLKDKNKIKEEVLRGKLISLEKEFEKFNFIIRCHKSYIVNTSFVKNITGNARGYYLHFDGLDKEIPVSRKFSKKDLELFYSF